MKYEFSDGVRKALLAAREHATRLHHDYLGTEHVLLGLLDDSDGTAAVVLTNLEVRREDVRARLDESVRLGKPTMARGELPYTNRAKKTLEFAMAAARELNDARIDTEHLLLGLLMEEKGIGAQVLMASGVTVEKVHAALARAPRDDDGPIGAARRSRVFISPPGPADAPLGWNDRITRALEHVLSRANAVAMKVGHDYVGTEHMLAALATDRRGGIAAALEALGVERDQLLEPVLEAAHRPAGRSRRIRRMSKALPYTSRALRAMEHALSEARDVGFDDAGPEHLLIGILLDGKSVAARILLAAGVTLERAREALAAARPESSQAGVSASHARPPVDPLLDASPVWFLEVDPSSDTPIYEQIIAGIEEAVATSRLEVGERLPTVRQLAEELGVAPGTVARGYSQLEKSGVLETEGARGTRVAARPPAAEPIAGRASTLEQSLRAVVVQGYHLGASADELRAALESAMAGIYDD